MDTITAFFNHTFAYCTDFIINCANILNLSYYEINFILFCLLYPALLLGAMLTYGIQRRRLRNKMDALYRKNIQEIKKRPFILEDCANDYNTLRINRIPITAFCQTIGVFKPLCQNSSSYSNTTFHLLKSYYDRKNYWQVKEVPI